MKIYGIPVGTTLPKPNWEQTDPTKGDYIKNKPNITPGGSGGTGEPGANGTTFIPAVDAAGNLSWSNDGGLENPETVNIMGPQGPQGLQGKTGASGKNGTTPHIGENGNWWIGDTDTGVSAGGSGASGVYVLSDGESLDNVPESAVLVVDPDTTLLNAEGVGF